MPGGDGGGDGTGWGFGSELYGGVRWYFGDNVWSFYDNGRCCGAGLGSEGAFVGASKFGDGGLKLHQKGCLIFWEDGKSRRF